jgi:hypothetical protein
MRGQVAAQPLLLWRACFAAADSHAITVDDHDVPGTEIVAAFPRLTRRAEIAKITGGVLCTVLVVADCGRVRAL